MHSLGSSNLSFTPVIQVLREFYITIFHIFYPYLLLKSEVFDAKIGIIYGYCKFCLYLLTVS